MRVKIESFVSPCADVLSQAVRGEMVLLDLGAEQYYALNAVGSQIWDLLDQGSTVRSLCSRLGERYPVEPERIERDVLELLNDLLAAGLIRVTERNHDD